MASSRALTPLGPQRIGRQRILEKDEAMEFFLEASVHFGPTNSIRELLKDSASKKTLMNMIERQVLQCVERNTPATKYPDSLLVDLYQEDPSFDNLTLFSLYVIEYMPGMSMANYSERLKILHASLAAGKAWDDAMENPPKTVADVMSSSYYWSPPNQPSSFSTTSEARTPAPGPTLKSTVGRSDTTIIESRNVTDPHERDDPFAKLNRVYHQALVDYYIADSNKSGISDKSTDKFSNVRFLRDTAENLLRVAEEEGMPQTHLYQEVRKVRDSSKEHAQWLAGGRKRVFDDQTRSRDENSFRHGHHLRHDNRIRREDYIKQEDHIKQEDLPAYDNYYGYHSPKRRMQRRGGRRRRDRQEQYDSYRPN